MNLIELSKVPSYTDDIRDFGGLCRLERCAPSELSMDENMSADYYPFLSSGGEKMLLSELQGECLGLHVKDKPCLIVSVTEGESAAAKLIYGGAETPLVLSHGEKQLVSMGTKIIVFPDKVYYDTYNGDYGSLESHFASVEGAAVTFSLARADGSGYPAEYSPLEPASPADGAYWCDTSAAPAVLKVYSESAESWTGVDSVYVKIEYPSIGEFFRKGDGVTVSDSEISSLNGTSVITGLDTDYIIIPGIIDGAGSQETPIHISRNVPEVDFAVECDNRLWGCRYGLDNSGNFVNEIYATKLGDPFNWQCFEGISTDSYAVSVGTDGPFTGAVTFLGSVLFFKEKCIHKVFGTKPSNFQLTQSTVNGVEKGCHRSLCIMNETLYYKGRGGIYAYDGAIPYSVSEKLGDLYMSDVICGRGTCNLYVSFADSEGVRQFYSFYPPRGVWHRATPENVSAFGYFEGVLIYTAGSALYATELRDGSSATLSALFGCEKKTELPEKWCFETGDLALRDGKNSYVTRIHLKMNVYRGCTVRVRIKIDGREWKPIGSVTSGCQRIMAIPIVTGRCSSIKLELSGSGTMVLYSIARTVEDAPEDMGGGF